MRKFIKKIILCLALVFLILNIFGIFLDYTIRKSMIFKICVLKNKDLPENIILGGSRALTGIKAERLSKLGKCKWYNLAMDDTPIKMHRLFLEILISKRIRISKIVLEYYNTNKINKSEEFDFIRKNEYQLLPFINDFIEVNDYLKSKRGFYFFKYLPIYKYIYFNTELFYPTLKLLVDTDFKYKFNNYGDYTYPNSLKGDLNNFTQNINVRLNFQNTDLIEMKNICIRKKIELKCVTGPIFNGYSDLVFPELHYNFIKLPLSQIFFYDKIHVNDDGSKLFTDSIFQLLYQR
jgi:hypothetical protein